MRPFRPFIFAVCVLLTTSCWNPFTNPFSGGDDSGEEISSRPSRVIEATDKFYLAIGGVASGRNELVIYDGAGNIRNFEDSGLHCEADNAIVTLEPRPDYATVAEGSGVKMTALSPGITAVRCFLGDEELADTYEVTIPPQSLIRILVAEAGQQLADEAETDLELGDDVVKTASSSPTGNALGAVIRNRIDWINIDDDPSLFEANEAFYHNDPPATYYDAVITAEGQFSPTDPEDPSYDVWNNAEGRALLSGEWQVAYDQAVITAAGIFNGDIEDSTTGAFAFRSPTGEEWNSLAQAWSLASEDIPADSGFTDSDFPNFAPIQILIQSDVWKCDDGRPSFTFARRRQMQDPAITGVP